jgi:hypothetical protein
MMGRALDGHINRVLEGKTIENVTKNGQMLIIRCTNGEEWGIAWANSETGEGYLGEPCLVQVNVRIRLPGVSLNGEAGSP